MKILVWFIAFPLETIGAITDILRGEVKWADHQLPMNRVILLYMLGGVIGTAGLLFYPEIGIRPFGQIAFTFLLGLICYAWDDSVSNSPDDKLPPTAAVLTAAVTGAFHLQAIALIAGTLLYLQTF